MKLFDVVAAKTPVNKEEHYKGVKHWVEDYKIMRKTGNIKGAQAIRNNIQKHIEKHKLNPKLVWGKDPEAK